MLPSLNRLAKTADIQTVQTRGRRFFNHYFVIKALPSQASPRFAFVVSTKVSKKAVVRNRIRRILREAVRSHLTNFRSGDYVIMVKSSAVGLDSPALVEQLLDFAQKIRLLNKL